MGQHCSCMKQSRKYQRRQSDDVAAVDMMRDDDDDRDQEMEVLVGHDDHEQEIHEVFGTRLSNSRSSQRGISKRSGLAVAIELLTDVDKREEEEEEEEEEKESEKLSSTGLMGLDTEYSRPTPSFSPEELSRLLRSYQEATGVVSKLNGVNETALCCRLIRGVPFFERLIKANWILNASCAWILFLK